MRGGSALPKGSEGVGWEGILSEQEEEQGARALRQEAQQQ